MFRVATKWVEELEKYFKEGEEAILKRECQYRMRQGRDYLTKQEFQLLNDILQYYYTEEGGPKSLMNKIKDNNYYHQAVFGYKDLDQRMKDYSVEQAAVGQYACFNQKNSEVYLIKYLNCLIHTLLKACEMFRRFLYIQSLYPSNYLYL